MAAREKVERRAAREANNRLSRGTRLEGVELFMECEEEELSPSQIAAHKRAEKEYLDAIQKINALKSANTQVIQGNQAPSALPVVSNPSPSVPETLGIGTQNQILVQGPVQQSFPQQPVQSLIGVPRVALPTSQSQQPQFIIQNTLPVPSVQPPPAAYKLLLDTRTGLILGTVPNDGQTLIATTGTTSMSGSQNPQTVAFVPVQNPNLVASQKGMPQIVNIVGPNKTITTVNHPTKMTVIPPQKQVLSISSNSLQNAQLQPVSSVGQIIKKVKTYESSETGSSETANGTNAGSVILKNAILSSSSASENASSFENSIQVKKVTVSNENAGRAPLKYPSLSVKAIPQRLACFSIVQRKQSDLDRTMNEVLQQSMSNLVKWMFEHGLFHISQQCLVHKSNAMHLVFDPRNEQDRSGGYKWQCSMCAFTLPIQHRSFFDSLGYRFVTMLKIIYYWACNEDIHKVLQETGVDACCVQSVYSLLRSICSNKVKLLIRLGGSDSRPVELAVQLLRRSSSNSSTLSIGCAYERFSGLVALRAFDKFEGKMGNFLQQYVLPTSTISVERDLRLVPLVVKENKYNIVLSPRSSGVNDPQCLILNAMAYLQERIIPMLGSMIVHLQAETIQSFLNELMWREKFGTNPYNAFNNILLHIKQHYGTGTSLLKPNPQPVRMPVVTVVSGITSKERPASESELQFADSTESPPLSLIWKHKRDLKSLDRNDSARKLVLLDDYYYAWQEGQNMKEAAVIPKSHKFKCHVCRKMFDNNIKMMRHLYAHIENSKQRNLDLSDLTQCKYCFREFETPYIMQCHVEDVHFKDSTSLMCRICDCAFKDKGSLVNHMHVTHTAAEMPYSCEVCKYRCSMYSKVIEHFQQEHNGTHHVQCHYCLRVFTIKYSSVQQIGFTNAFWMHIYKHQTKSLSRKCSACCLTFTGINEMKQHRINDHISHKNNPSIKRFPSDKSKEIYLYEPSKDARKIPKSRILKAGGSRGSYVKQHWTRVVPQTFVEIQPGLLEGMRCLECKSSMDVPEHFLRYVCCSMCHYSTYCGKAFANHMIFRHSQIRRDDYAWPVYLPRTMFCICGYSHTRGNAMAYHLEKCGRHSCYPNRKAALKATVHIEHLDSPSPTTNSDNEMAEDSEKELSVDLLLIEPEQQICEEKIIEKKAEENPSMLNILGLMRKPSRKKLNRNVSGEGSDATSVSLQGESENIADVSEEESKDDQNENDADHGVAVIVELHESDGEICVKDIKQEDSMEVDDEPKTKNLGPVKVEGETELNDVADKAGERLIQLKDSKVGNQANSSTKFLRNRRRKRKKPFGKEWTRRKGSRTRRNTIPFLAFQFDDSMSPDESCEVTAATNVSPNEVGIIVKNDSSEACVVDAVEPEEQKDEPEGEESTCFASQNTSGEDGCETKISPPDVITTQEETQPILISCTADISDNLDDEAMPPVLDCYADSKEIN